MSNNPDLRQMSRREIEDFLVERSLVDPEFRKRLLGDARTTISSLGIVVGPDVTIRVLEEEPQSFYVVLPRVLGDGDDLSDDELRRLDGGVASRSGAERFFQGFL